MSNLKIEDLNQRIKVGKDETKNILGGGSTVPVPDRSYLMIGTWPTPEKPRVLRPSRRSWFCIDTVPLPE